MKEAVVTDSTCLIALERLGQLDLLPSLFESIYAPREVAVIENSGFPLSWLKVVDLADPAALPGPWLRYFHEKLSASH